MLGRAQHEAIVKKAYGTPLLMPTIGPTLPHPNSTLVIVRFQQCKQARFQAT